MKKRIISMLAAMSLMASPVALADENGKVEISFKVGDSVLTVNGAPLEVTAPYVVGEGTTLVPVRVITEAFGAEVIWDGTDQSVNLKYPDVDITIKIGSKSAIVNTHTEELAEAPQLYMDTTMVPLRFISETFGAKVTYDDATRLITVTKEAMEAGNTLEGATDMEYIGDSYYGWSMKNPKKLQMTDRSFDGISTEFADETGDNVIGIFIEDSEEDVFDVDTEYNEVKSFFNGMTLTMADKKDLGQGKTKIHFQGKDKETLLDIIVYINGKRMYSVGTIIDLESEMKDELLAIADTFAINESRQMYELSNVVGGYREFKDEDYKITLKLPASWAAVEGSQSNEFAFYNNENDADGVSIGIYSKSETVSAAGLAAHDRGSKVEILNKDMSVISDVLKSKLGERESYYYTIDFNGGGSNDRFLNDTFVEVGDYVYNIAVYAKSPEEASSIIRTFTMEELDSKEVGIILRESDLGTNKKLEVLDGTMPTTSMWENLVPLMDTLIERRSSSLLSVVEGTRSNNVAEFGNEVQQMYNSALKDEEYTRVAAIKSKNTDAGIIYSFTMKQEHEDGEVVYITTYARRIDGVSYYFLYLRNDVYYEGSIDAEVEDMVAGFELD